MTTPDELLAWLRRRDKVGLGVPMGEIGEGLVDALAMLQHDGKVHLTADPPMVWLDPSVVRDKRRRKRKDDTFLDSDLPSDVPMMKHQPDRDSRPVPGMRLNGEPVYRPRDEPSSLILCGSRPWPPEGTEIKPRWYRPARAKWTTEERRDMVVTAECCPVCGRAESKKTSAQCLACDHWPSSYPTTVRTLEAEPDDQSEKKKPRKKGAKTA